MKYYMGIDPGKQGALAIIWETRVLAVMVMPISGNGIDYHALAVTFQRFITDVGDTNLIACIEKVHAMPGQGVTSMFNFGFVTGAIHGILSTLEIPYHLVTPQAWKKEILAGTAKDKNAAIDYCLRAYPNINLLATERSRIPHSGIADAICIATYASHHY